MGLEPNVSLTSNTMLKLSGMSLRSFQLLILGLKKRKNCFQQSKYGFPYPHFMHPLCRAVNSKCNELRTWSLRLIFALAWVHFVLLVAIIFPHIKP